MNHEVRPNTLISIIIPNYNEVESILHTITKIEAEFKKLGIDNYEIIIVDDYSTDNSITKINSLQSEKIWIFCHNKNRGQHQAIINGCMLVRGQGVIFMAADGQDCPSTIPLLLDKWRTGSKVVWALRKIRSEPFYKKIPVLAFYKLIRILSKRAFDIELSRADFALIDTTVVKNIFEKNKLKKTIHELILRSGHPQDFIEYNRPKRRFGKSKWSFVKKINLALNIIKEADFRSAPLFFFATTKLFFSFNISF